MIFSLFSSKPVVEALEDAEQDETSTESFDAEIAAAPAHLPACQGDGGGGGGDVGGCREVGEREGEGIG